MAKGTSCAAQLVAYNSKRTMSSTSADAAGAMTEEQLQDLGFTHAVVEIIPEGSTGAGGYRSWKSHGLSGLGSLGSHDGPDGQLVFDQPGRYSVQFHLSAVLPCQAYVMPEASIAGSADEEHLHLGPPISSPVYPIEVVQPGLPHANGCVCISISKKARLGGMLEMALKLCMDGQPVDLAAWNLQAIRVQSRYLDSR